MSRHPQLAVGFLLAIWSVTTVPVCAADAQDLKPTAKIVKDLGPFEFKQPLSLVVRNAEELVASSTQPLKSKDREVQREMTVALAKLFKVDTINWIKQMVVAIMAGGGRGDAGALDFESILLKEEVLTVNYKGPVFPDHTCAGNVCLALIPRCGGEVKFIAANDTPRPRDPDSVKRQEEIDSLIAVIKDATYLELHDPGKAKAVARLQELGEHAAPAVAAVLAEGLKKRKRGWEEVFRGLYILQGMGPSAKVAIKDVILALEDDHATNVGEAANILKNIGTEAKAAVPALRDAWSFAKGKPRSAEKDLAEALKTIDPKMALELGIK